MDIDRYLQHQFYERYRAFIICGSGMTGKTKLVRKLADKYHGKYIDIAQEISRNINLKEHIDAVRPEQIYSLIVNQNRTEQFIIADHIDMIFSLWTHTQKKEFLRRLDMKSNGSCILAVLHNYKLLDQERTLRDNSFGEKRVINIAEIA